MSAAAHPSSSGLPSMQRPLATTGGNQVFDFTKRKRWADLLVTELAEAIILILSPQCKVLFCGNAVTEMLGWRDSDLIDCDLADFMNEEDKVVFKADFYESIKQRKPMSSYARIWSQSSASTFNSVNGQQTKDTLFEIQGSAHYNSDSASTCKCFFAVAKPFPSRNTAMLDTFLESKLENDRLQRRLKSLKTLKAQKVAVAASGSSFTGSRMHPAPLSLPSSSSSPYQMYSSGMTQAQAVAAAKMFDQDSMMQRTPTSSKFDQSMMYGASAQYSPPKQEEDQLEEGGKKKKAKKVHGVEQHVCMTCGRTDSPEWRKGPHGPKTLCNACGLRWAKQMRKPNDDSGGPSGSGGGGQPSNMEMML